MVGELLSALTAATNFVGLVVSLWLGLYIVTRSPRSRVSWLASGTLWALAGYFLNNLTYVQGPPGSRLPWWWGWSVALAVPLWFHLSVLLLPEEAAHRQRWWVPLSYFVTLNLVAMEAFTPWVFEGTTTEPALYSSAQRPGPLYPLFVLYLVAVPMLSTYNLAMAWRQARGPVIRKQLGLLAWAAALAVFAGAYTGVSVWLGLGAPLVITSLALAAGVALLGYSVARYNALVEGRALGVDLPYTALAMGLVVATYLLAAWISNVLFGVPFIAFVFVIMLAIVSHSLYDRGRSILDRVFYRQRQQELRADLRRVVNRIQPQADIREGLRAVLETLCRALSTAQGWVALREGTGFTPAAHYGRVVLPESLPADPLTVQEASLSHGTDAEQLGGMAVVVPLHAGGKQLGAIVLGERRDGLVYGEDELQLLEDCADPVAHAVQTANLQAHSMAQIEGLLRQVRVRDQQLQQHMRSALGAGETPLTLAGMGEDEAVALVEDALRRLYDYSYLGQHDLAKLRAAERHLEVHEGGPVTHIDRGKALQRLLLSALDKLKPSGERPLPASREWWQYVVLYDCYVFGAPNRDVMSALYIGEGTFNRARRRALRAVTRAMAEMERQA
jgi:hypothetical protein